MTREIKFRAWDKNLGMTQPFYLSDTSLILFESVRETGYYKGEYFFSTSVGKAWKVMQYTGLKDKNGVEICEGDIVKIPDDWDTYGLMAGEIREIYFKDGCYRFKPSERKIKMGERGCYMDDSIGEIKVIGNIYENPELLDKE